MLSAHVLLLFDPENASNQQKSSVVCDLKKAGYEVMEAHDLNTAAALLYVSRRVEAVVVHAADGQIGPEFKQSVTAIRPGLPLLLLDQILIANQNEPADEAASTKRMKVATTV